MANSQRQDPTGSQNQGSQHYARPILCRGTDFISTRSLGRGPVRWQAGDTEAAGSDRQAVGRFAGPSIGFLRAGLPLALPCGMALVLMAAKLDLAALRLKTTAVDTSTKAA